ncbi:MAG TPA: glutathione peroxidase [Cytophagales bacterium]|nr:glutathione peroxidase [Cytophagales bacterium]HAA19916.1 glutathione peroxidase [Cytophagales bacterium]HAP62657.1 glutathione peroxidase [Cytophagales bacterium]
MSIHSLSITTLNGDMLNLSDYQGKYMLLVNVASECGFTPQYGDLQEFYQQHSDKAVVIGFPSNQFGGQEPGTAEEIASFCQKNYGVTFPIVQKADVRGSNKQTVYQWLTEAAQNGWNNEEPSWNFHKYLVGPDGKLLKVLPSAANPFDSEILDEIDN